MFARLSALFAAIVMIALTLVSCGGSGGGAPQAGTPEWYWAAAKETYTAGDFEKAQEHLERVAESASEYKDQAALWHAVVVAGLARGYMELGNSCEEAMASDPKLTDALQNRLQQFRRDARRHAITFTESVAALRKIAESQPAVKLQFPFPAGSATESPILVSLRGGEKVPDAQIDSAIDYTLKRGVLLQATLMAGAGEDVAKAQSLYDSGAAQVAAPLFLQVLGKSLFDVSALFGRKQLNEPKIQKVMLDSALQCLEPALSAEDQDLKKESQKIKEEIDKEAKRLKV